ncbi:hypothetical protein N781_00380 [Pontibacillus halophilus JSM 076056 = DSM 19796]|uniref:Uncharacterized protein n=1 Tax=Pontibacillus halophilus JSM 076056 = DSM 19796 TaxID=1385510 RepID=A0A0A5GQ22_9BACI|nr:hypothetical protein [Pontibacillus halophilus]KGX94044.1 hypothetical protein N781_00380 [Pontibacillus halophilus JSM 076056 = DSM 19796]
MTQEMKEESLYEYYSAKKEKGDLFISKVSEMLEEYLKKTDNK